MRGEVCGGSGGGEAVYFGVVCCDYGGQEALQGVGLLPVDGHVVVGG